MSPLHLQALIIMQVRDVKFTSREVELIYGKNCAGKIFGHLVWKSIENVGNGNRRPVVEKGSDDSVFQTSSSPQ